MIAKKRSLPKVMFFGSGTFDGGGSGIRKMLENIEHGLLEVEVVAIVTNHANGGVAKVAREFGIPFIIVPADVNIKQYRNPLTISFYRQVFKDFKPDYVMLSGWLFRIPKEFCGPHMLNIHPGPALEDVDKGKHGDEVHSKVFDAFNAGTIYRTCLTIHVVNEHYDDGDVVFSYPITITLDDSPEDIKNRVNAAEHIWQTHVLNRYVRSSRNYREILCDGVECDAA